MNDKTMVHQRAANYSTPNKFTSKELDDETGLYYFGARYYHPELSIWHGMDPLSDLTPDWNPFRYCFNNPINIHDPDGMFEDKESAKRFAEQNGIKTGFFRDHKIKRQKDGSWAITNNDKIAYYYGGYAIQEISVVEKRSNNSSNKDYNLSGLSLAVAGLGSEILEERLINKNTLYDWSTGIDRSINYTGSPLATSLNQRRRYNAFTKSLIYSKSLNVSGKLIGAYQAFDLNDQKRNGEINEVKFYGEQVSNTYSTLGGFWGAVWGYGWEGGRTVTKTDWYHKYIFLHYNPGGRDGLISTYK